MGFPRDKFFEYSSQEESVNVITHAIGALFGVFVLYQLNSVADSVVKVAAFTTYGSSMIILFLSSVLYHFSRSSVWKPRFRTFDHVCIYLITGGTYTPFILLGFQAWWGHWYLLGVWPIA
jgi:hemolysin III